MLAVALLPASSVAVTVADTVSTPACNNVLPSTSNDHSSLPLLFTTVALPISLPSSVTVTISPALTSPPTVPVMVCGECDSAAVTTSS